MSRPSWDEYFMGFVEAASKRATCDRGRNGAVVVISHRVITTGYVGSAHGEPHCDDVGHLFEEVIHADGQRTKHCVRTLHAEENAILQAAEFGIAIKGATLYSKLVPCIRCARRIHRVGIIRVVAQKRYHVDEKTLELFKKNKIQLDILENKVEIYENQ